jgi:hypothetical protein
MGQYYVIVNVDKKELIDPSKYDNGVKLMEFSYIGNEVTNALMNLMNGRWKGDRVYVVGDYADTYTAPGAKEECWVPAYRDALEEFGIDENDEDKSKEHTLYDFAYRHFKNVSQKTYAKNPNLWYIVNHKTKQFIDLEHCPDESSAGEFIVHPLSLLLAMGNDRGGGDFRKRCNGYEYVGTWCDSVRDIELLPSDADASSFNGLTEFLPGFEEPF